MPHKSSTRVVKGPGHGSGTSSKCEAGSRVCAISRKKLKTRVARCRLVRGLSPLDRFRVNRGVTGMRYEIDKLIMLLSADWFFPYWGVIGIFGEPDQRAAIKSGCREIVQQITSGVTEYWSANFSVDRLNNTRELFSSLLQRSKLPQVTLKRLRSLISREEPGVDEGTQWLLVSMTQDLLRESASSSGSGVGTEVLEALRGGLQQWQNTEIGIDLKQRCIASDSNWDRYLRSLTPDLPAMLADYVWAMASESRFDVLWGYISVQLTTQQRQQLIEWFRSQAQVLTGEPLRLAHEI